MHRLATFYKWISAGRVFRIIAAHNQLSSHELFNLGCIVKRCIKKILDTLPNLKIMPQKQPSLYTSEQALAHRGFPNAKKCLLFQLIKLFNFNRFFIESNKYIIE